MFKRLICGALAILLIALSPLQAIAASNPYPQTQANVPPNERLRQALEDEFRTLAKELTRKYIRSHVGDGGLFSSGDGDWRIYREAARLKHDFDSEKGILGAKHGDLAYNTSEEQSKRDYNQETREITFYMLSQNVQHRIYAINELTPAQRRQLYPGRMLNAVTGSWEFNEQAMIAEAIDQKELEKEIESGIAEAQVLFAKTSTDLFFGVYAPKFDQAFDITDAVMTAIEGYCQAVIDITFEREKDILKNAYRQAMIDDLVAAQHNVDQQMYEGLYQLRDTLDLKQGMLSADDAILLECLDTVLGYVDQARTQKEIIARQYTEGSVTESFDDAIEAIAEKAVDSLGMTEKEIMDEQQQLAIELVYFLKEGLKNIIHSGLRNAVPDFDESMIFSLLGTSLDTALDTCFEGFLLASAQESMDKNHNGRIETTEVLTFFAAHASINGVKDLMSSISDHFIDKGIDKAERLYKVADMAAEKAANDWKALSSRKQQKKYSWKNKDRKKLAEARDKALNEWEDKKQSKGALSAMIENGIELAHNTLKLANTTADLMDSGRDEVPISYVASTMYRAYQTALETEKLIKDRYEHFVNPLHIGWISLTKVDEDLLWDAVDKAIDAAELAELRDFINAMYSVVNTDLLGQSYYTSLCSWYEYQKSPDDFRNNVLAAGELYKQQWNTMHSKGFIPFLGFFVFSPIFIDAYFAAAIISSADSEYLDYVAEKSTRGSWFTTNDSIALYNKLGDYAEQFRIDPRYLPLFY